MDLQEVYKFKKMHAERNYNQTVENQRKNFENSKRKVTHHIHVILSKIIS